MKHLINESLLVKMSREICRVYPAFPKGKFIRLGSSLEPLELKARVLLVTSELRELLPQNYPDALHILVCVMENDKLSGLDLWPFSEYIGQFGLDDFDESLHAMTVLTQRFTAEFAVRPFFIKDQKKVLKFFMKNSNHRSHHIRRWISEGSRPLLPWGERLPAFVADPSPTLQLLDKLKYDEELYVRKSVANHLNDISKHHPLLVISTLEIWLGQCPDEHLEKLQWIKRHGLRTLIKKGHKRALKLMGVLGEANIKISKIKLKKKDFSLNDKLEFQFELESSAKKSQKILVDYLIDFQKSGGKKASKVFKLKVVDLAAGEKIIFKKTHNLRPITTMTYYKGLHHLMIQVNGKIVASVDWYFDL
jgi:3-methyladenine DNA glycosylase AlkC